MAYPQQPPAPGGPQFVPVPTPKKKPNVLLLVLAGVGAFVLLCCGGGAIIAVTSPDTDTTGDTTNQITDSVASGSSTGKIDSTKAAGNPTPAKPTPAKPTGPGIGDPARDGKFEFTVTKVACGKTRIGAEPFDATAQGVFCLINVTVKNIGKEARSFSGVNQKAFSRNGAEYANSTEAEMYANKDANTFLNEVNPGNSVKGVLVFDVPKGTRLTKIELHDSMFSGGVTVRLT